jgi:hypothetical protein
MRGFVLASVLSMPALAAAGPLRTARLDVTGTCELSTLAARTNELAGRIAVTTDAPALISITTAAHDDGKLGATLVLYDERRATQPLRTVTASTCDELETSLAVVVSLVVQQDPAPPLPLPAAPEVPLPPPPVEPAVDRPLEALPQRRTSPAVILGVAHASSGESSLVIGGEKSWFGAELQLAAIGIDPDYGHADITLARLAVTPCMRWSVISACAVAMAGLAHGHGEDLMTPETSIRPTAGVGGRLEWHQALGASAGLRVFLDGMQLVAKTTFLIDDEVVWTTPARTVSAGVGIYFQLP